MFKGAGANILRGVAGAGVLSLYDKLQEVMFGKVYSGGAFPLCDCSYCCLTPPILQDLDKRLDCLLVAFLFSPDLRTPRPLSYYLFSPYHAGLYSILHDFEGFSLPPVHKLGNISKHDSGYELDWPTFLYERFELANTICRLLCRSLTAPLLRAWSRLAVASSLSSVRIRRALALA